MALPVYNLATMPAVLYPMKQSQPIATRFLGKKAIVNDTVISFNIKCKNDTEMATLYTFWETTCNYGTERFNITMPLFGTSTTLECRFVGELSVDSNGCPWNVPVTIETVSTLTEISYTP